MSWIPFGSILLKLKDVAIDPKTHYKLVKRAMVDGKDIVIDVAINRGAAKIAFREVRKKVFRGIEDIRDNYKKFK